VITCSRCGKENQDHYKFCLGCGAKLEAPQAAPELDASSSQPGFAGQVPSETSTRTGSGPASGLGRAPTPPPVPMTPPPSPVLRAPSAPGSTPSGVSAAAAGLSCPECGSPVLPTNTFCGRCGHRLKPVASPEEPASGSGPKTMFMAGGTTSGETGPRGHLTLIRPDGSEGGMHPLSEGETLVGRGQGPLFDADPYLSPRHGEFRLGADGLVVRDLGSLNGVFLKVTDEEPLDSGTIFRIGQELLRFDVISPPSPLEDGTEVIGTPNPGFWGRISVIVGRDVDGPAFPIFEESIVLGRERGDILFPEDGYVSATHARIALRENRVYLQDLGSSNGTFVRLEEEREIPPGSLLLMGQQLFRVQFQ